MAAIPQGKLITFEGGEGCGKSTQIILLEKALRACGVDVVVTREPGGTPIGERLRHLLKFDEAAHGMCAETELLLFAASRAQLVREVIAPALAAGKYVLCDRFLDSTTVYQGVARRLSPEAVEAANHIAVGQTLPDLTVILDLPAEVGLERARLRAAAQPQAGTDRMEQEALAFYEKVREGYLGLAAAKPGDPDSSDRSKAENNDCLAGAKTPDRVTQAYLGAIHTGQEAAHGASLSGRFLVIAADQSPEAIHAAVAKALAGRFGLTIA